MVKIGKINYDNDGFRQWATKYSHSHSKNGQEYNYLLCWLIYIYQKKLIGKILGRKHDKRTLFLHEKDQGSKD